MPSKKPRLVYALKGKREYLWPDWYPPEGWDIPVRCACGEYWYDPDEAWRYENWFPNFARHPEGTLKGEPIELLPWQKGPTREIFGWQLRRADGELTDIRKYLDAFIGVPKKNNKTTWGAGLTLAVCDIDGEPTPQCFFCAGGSEEQAADNGFRIAKGMISQSDDLRDIYTCWEDLIEHNENDGFIRLLSSAPKGKDGKNVHWVYIDEKFELTDNKMENSLRTGMVARRKPMMFGTTTAGNDITSPTYAEWEFARKVIEGTIKAPRYFAEIFEMDPGDDWRDPEVWKKVNPGWGYSVNGEILKAIYDKALGNAVNEAAFRQYHLNSWESTALPYIPLPEWDRCKKDFTLDDLRSQNWAYVVGAYDFAQKHDMSALVLLFVRRNGEAVEYYVYVEYFVPEATRNEREHRGFRYPDWVANGLLNETDGFTTDYRTMRNRMKELRLMFPQLKMVPFDPQFAGEIAPNMQEEDGFEMIALTQNFRTLGPATKRLLDLVKDQQISHNGHEILRWNVQNATVITSNEGSVMLSKKKSKDLIDGLAGIIFALSQALKLPPPPKASVYAGRGLR